MKKPLNFLKHAFVRMYISFACGVLAIFSAAVAPVAAAEAVPATLRLDWTTLGYHAPFYYGVAQGIYEQEGIKLTIEEGKGSASVAQLAASGNDDFGFSDATTVAQLVAKGLPGKVVMGILRGTTLAMFFPPDRGIKTPADLQGRTISVCPGDAISVYIEPYLKSLGLGGTELDKLSVDCTLKYTVVAQGRADLVMSYGTAGRPLLQKVGIADPATLSPGPGFYLPGHGINERPDVVRRFVAATAKAWEAAAKDPDAAVKAIIDARPLLKADEVALKDTFLISLDYLDAPSSAGHPFGWQSPDDWETALDLLDQYADMASSVQPSDVITNDFIPEK